jgi:hypothetical protein
LEGLPDIKRMSGKAALEASCGKTATVKFYLAWKQIRLAISGKSTKRIDNMLRGYGQERSRRQ